jgi:hypothetical protein
VETQGGCRYSLQQGQRTSIAGREWLRYVTRSHQGRGICVRSRRRAVLGFGGRVLGLNLVPTPFTHSRTGLTSDQPMEGFPWTAIHFASQRSLLDFGFDTGTEAHGRDEPGKTIDERDVLTHPWGK